MRALGIRTQIHLWVQHLPTYWRPEWKLSPPYVLTFSSSDKSVLESPNLSAKICLKSNLKGRGRCVLESRNPKCHDPPNFQFSGGGGVFWTKFQNRGELSNSLACLCITDSLSHTTMWRLTKHAESCLSEWLNKLPKDYTFTDIW